MASCRGTPPSATPRPEGLDVYTLGQPPAAGDCQQRLRMFWLRWFRPFAAATFWEPADWVGALAKRVGQRVDAWACDLNNA